MQIIRKFLINFRFVVQYIKNSARNFFSLPGAIGFFIAVRLEKDMRKALSVTFVITVSLLSVFIFNIFLYALSPSYRELFQGIVYSDDGIPVVYVSNPDVNAYDPGKPDYDNTREILPVETPLAVSPNEGVEGTTNAAAESEESVDEENPSIVDRNYYEDCGTGKGYWVITYSDGSTSIEEY